MEFSSYWLNSTSALANKLSLTKLPQLQLSIYQTILLYCSTEEHFYIRLNRIDLQEKLVFLIEKRKSQIYFFASIQQNLGVYVLMCRQDAEIYWTFVFQILKMYLFSLIYFFSCKKMRKKNFFILWMASDWTKRQEIEGWRLLARWSGINKLEDLAFFVKFLRIYSWLSIDIEISYWKQS